MLTALETWMPKSNRAWRIRRAGPADFRFSSRRQRTGLIRLACLFLVSAPGATQSQTLTQALAEAYNTNPQLLAQRALLRATDEQVPQALANWRPTVNFTGQVGGTRAVVTAPSTGLARLNSQGVDIGSNGLSTYSTFYQNNLNLQTIQPVYTGGRTAAQTSQAINNVQATRAQTLAVETSVFQSVAQAYLDVVRDQALVQVNRNNVAVLRKQLEATQDRFRVGEVTRTDVAQAEASLAQAIGQLVTTQGNL